MSRIQPVDSRAASGEVKQLLDTVQSALGATPNFTRVLAHSPAALAGFVGLYGGIAKANIDLATRERIALVVAEENECHYCVSAHTAIGRKAGLSQAEMVLNRSGGSSDAKAAAAVAFGDAEIAEIIAIVTLNFFTNLVGKAAQLDIDFPKVALLEAAA
jgi:AhpD family alkylhydroperoxidase